MYHFFMKNQRPYTQLKWAQSLDGKICLPNNQSRWITNEQSREKAHHLRGIHQGIMISARTLLKDNSLLNLRHGCEGKYTEPQKIIIGSLTNDHGPLDLFKNPQTSILNFGEFAPPSELAPFVKYFKVLKNNLNAYSIEEIWKILGEEKIASVLVEGGSFLFSEIIKKNFYQKISIFLGNKILGQGPTATDYILIEEMKDALEVKLENVENLKDNILLEYS